MPSPYRAGSLRSRRSSSQQRVRAEEEGPAVGDLRPFYSPLVALHTLGLRSLLGLVGWMWESHGTVISDEPPTTVTLPTFIEI